MRRRSIVAAFAAVLCGAVYTTISIASSAQAAAPAAGSVYQLAVTKSGMCIDVPSASTANSALLQQWGCNSGAAWQQFKLVAAGSNYLIQNVNSGKCIDVPAFSTVSGVQLQQYTCVSSQTNQQWKFTASGSGTYQIINIGSGLCVSDKGASTASGAAIIQETCSANSNKQWALNLVSAGSSDTGSPVGWASQNGGTTGGAGGSTVTVTTASALDSALASTSAMTIRVSGMISLTGMHSVASNKSILGVGSASGITGGGLNVSGVKNVIIRNLVFKNADDDSINVQSGATNIWIDHNDLSNGYDGLVDIKRGSDFITVSWNKTHDHDKTMLLGHSDDNGAQDIGHLRVTYHHNWFNGTNQRHPRVRFGNPVHVYNNYYTGIGSYGVASACDAGVFVENNYFENVGTPTATSAGDSPAGNLKASGNYLTGSGAIATRNSGSVASIPYSYAPDAGANVKSVVTSGAGTGKIGL